MQKSVNDGLASVLGALGDPARDKAASVYYTFPVMTDHQLMNAYRGSWIARKIVNIPAYDSVRAWRDWSADKSDISRLTDEENRLNLRAKMLQARVKARLFGGAAIFLGTSDIAGNDPLALEKPLDVKRIGKGGLRYITPLSRVDVKADTIDNDPVSEFFGKPEFYQVNGNRVHASRFALFDGAMNPEPRLTFGQDQGWGDSVLLAAMSAIMNADSVPANVASLVFEANVDVFGVPNFLSQLTDPAYERRLMSRFALVGANKAINRSILKDAAETYERKGVSFAQTPELIRAFMEIVCGACDIPATRFLGQSPGGMNSTGESDLRNYYDSVSASQTLETTPSIYALDEVLKASTFGTVPGDMFYQWAPLWQISAKEKADIGKTYAETANILVTANLINAEALEKTVPNQFIELGLMPGLEAAIAEAGPVEPGELETPETPPVTDRAVFKDMEPRPLYVSRKVLNGAAIIAWAKDAGFAVTVPVEDLHVTVIYSRQPVDWFKMGAAWESEMKVPAGGPRLVEQFGKGAIVIHFASSELEWRNSTMRERGASSDHDEYSPHITFAYDLARNDLENIRPYQGEILLGPEIFENLKP